MGQFKKSNMVFCELLTRFFKNDVQFQILTPTPHDGLELWYDVASLETRLRLTIFL